MGREEGGGFRMDFLLKFNKEKERKKKLGFKKLYFLNKLKKHTHNRPFMYIEKKLYFFITHPYLKPPLPKIT